MSPLKDASGAQRPLSAKKSTPTPYGRGKTRNMESDRNSIAGSRGYVHMPTPASRDSELDMVSFALSWAPYGGPSEEEIFLRYGIPNPVFVDKLWASVANFELGRKIHQALLDAYPQRGRLR